MEFRAFYKTLGVSSNANNKATIRALRQLARQYRPDKYPIGPEAFKTFNKIDEVFGAPRDVSLGSTYAQLGHNSHYIPQEGGYRSST